MPLESDRFPSLPVTQPKMLIRGQLTSMTVAQFMAANPRTAATRTITISGAVANGDSLQITVTLPALPGGAISKTVALTGTDTTVTAAQKLAKALTDDATLDGFGSYADSNANVVTLYWPGPLGNAVVISQSVLVGAEVLTLSNAGALSGGSGAIMPYNTFNFAMPDGSFFAFEAGVPVIVGGPVITALAAAGSPVS